MRSWQRLVNVLDKLFCFVINCPDCTYVQDLMNVHMLLYRPGLLQQVSIVGT